MSLTGILDVDREILKYVDDEKLLKVCSINKRMWTSVCDDAFLRRRLNKYPEIDKYRKDESLKTFYSRVVFHISKMQTFNFVYTSGDFYKQLYLLKEYTEESLLVQSVMHGELNLVKYSLKNGIDINTSYSSAIKEAAHYGHLEILKCLEEAGGNIFVNDNFPLRLAAAYGHLEVIKYLIGRGADIHAYENYSLIISVKNGNIEIVKYLVDHGADVINHKNRCLKIARDYKHSEIEEYLKQLRH